MSEVAAAGPSNASGNMAAGPRNNSEPAASKGLKAIPRIAVSVKRVPAGEPGLTGRGLVSRSGPGRLNPHDGAALELAARIRDLLGVPADVISMGPKAAEETIKEALCLAGGKGYLLTDPAFAGADSLATARALEAALALKGPYDLVICGLMTTDGGTGQVGPALAALAGRAFVGRVDELVEAGPNNLVVSQRFPDMRAILRVSFPAVATVLQGAFPPRVPTIRDRLRKKECEIVTLSDLPDSDPGLYGEKGSATAIRRVWRPRPIRRKALSPSPQNAARLILDEAAQIV